MNNLLFKPVIEKFKNQDMSVFPILYSKFEKLIVFYARKLDYEDAASELTVFLIELFYGIDLSRFTNDTSFGIKRYIAVSIRNYYISLSQKQKKYKCFSNELYENLDGYCHDYDEKISLFGYLNFLSEKQKLVLIYKYIYGYSEFEIANLLDISRQAVNRIKNRGVAVLKEIIEGGEYEF